MVVDLRQLHLSDCGNNIVIDQSYISIIGSNSPLIMSVDSDIFLYKFFYSGTFWYNKCSQGLLILNLLFFAFRLLSAWYSLPTSGAPCHLHPFCDCSACNSCKSRCLWSGNIFFCLHTLLIILLYKPRFLHNLIYTLRIQKMLKTLFGDPLLILKHLDFKAVLKSACPGDYRHLLLRDSKKCCRFVQWNKICLQIRDRKVTCDYYIDDRMLLPDIINEQAW